MCTYGLRVGLSRWEDGGLRSCSVFGGVAARGAEGGEKEAAGACCDVSSSSVGTLEAVAVAVAAVAAASKMTLASSTRRTSFRNRAPARSRCSALNPAASSPSATHPDLLQERRGRVHCPAGAPLLEVLLPGGDVIRADDAVLLNQWHL